MKTEILNTLYKELGQKVRSDSFTAYCYESDIGKTIRRRPIAVIFPENSEDISTILRIANDFQIPVTVRGGGTTVGGETVAMDSILIDTKSMGKLIEIDLKGKFVYIESGMTWIELYDILNKYNFTFKVAPASATCTVGGTISVGGFDNHSFIYGTSADQVEEIEVILPGGEKKVCNSNTNSTIFNNSLYGNGLIGIITKIKMRIRNHTGKSYENWFAYPDRKSALQDYYKACENGTSAGVMYMEVLNQPLVFIEEYGETGHVNKMAGKLINTVIDDNFYINHARNRYRQRIRIHSFINSFYNSPISPSFIDVVYPDRNCIPEMFDYSDKIWKNVKKCGIKTLLTHKLCLALRVKEDSKTRPFSPFPSEINKGDLIFGSYFGTEIFSKDYLKYQQTFNEKMIKKTIEKGGMLYKYCGDVKMYAKNMFSEERWAYLIDIKKKYDPNNILNRGVLFE